MCKILQLLIALLFLQFAAFAQAKNDYQWVYGTDTLEEYRGGVVINFNVEKPDIFRFDLPYRFGFTMPCSISDDEGNLQFYSNGCQIANYNNEIIENGSDLSPGEYNPFTCGSSHYGYEAYQNMMILPRPGHPGRYVYFHPRIELDDFKWSALYTEVDMNANNGQGKVISKNQVLQGPSYQERAFTAVKHGNGRDWWLLIPQEYDFGNYENIYNFHLLTPDTILGPFPQRWKDSEPAENYKDGGNVVASPDGKKFAQVTRSGEPGANYLNQILLFDFDRCSGTLSNPKVITAAVNHAYDSWTAISPNSRFLYFQIAQNKLYQYDLQAPDIEASAQLIAEYDGFVTTPHNDVCDFNGLALAPNNKIYMCPSSEGYCFHTIHSPDKPGMACDFRQHDLELPTFTSTLMPLYPNYRLGPIDGSPCDTLGIDNLPIANFRWAVQDTLIPLQVEFTDLSYFEPSTWEWDFGDPLTSTANVSQEVSPLHQFSAPGNYTVGLTVCNANGCNTTYQDVSVMTVGVVTVPGESGKILLSPNPVTDVLRIQFEMPFAGEVVISDFSGRSLEHFTFSEGMKYLDVPIANFSNGVYAVCFIDSSGKLPICAKFIVIN